MYQLWAIIVFSIRITDMGSDFPKRTFGNLYQYDISTRQSKQYSNLYTKRAVPKKMFAHFELKFTFNARCYTE